MNNCALQIDSSGERLIVFTMKFVIKLEAQCFFFPQMAATLFGFGFAQTQTSSSIQSEVYCILLS